MADWYKNAVQTLIRLYQNDPKLYAEIRKAVNQIQRDPTVGSYVKQTYRVYVDPESRFRIGYNYHSQAKELEIVVIHVISS